MHPNQEAQNNCDQLISLKQLMQLTGLSRATIYRQSGRSLPRQIQITPRRIGWLASEIRAWQESLCNSRPKDIPNG